ncbi:hypothetical protein ABG768_002050 [Culter alburnus]|uniref:Uncharacterized protein n=1 Tax=Culter alburnus TaxID=194366 RepID=A0AAW2A252_CULAL
MTFQEKQSEFVKIFAETGSVTLSLLLIIFNIVMDNKFECPCRNDQNTALTVPLRYGWFHCPEGVKDDTLKNCPKALISYWRGVYVHDKELNMLWCKPTEGMRNETELRDLTRKYIHQNIKLVSIKLENDTNIFFSFFFFSSFSFQVMSCSLSSVPCDRCPSRLLLFFGRKERYSGGNRRDDVELSPTSSITTQPLIAFSKKE